MKGLVMDKAEQIVRQAHLYEDAMRDILYLVCLDNLEGIVEARKLIVTNLWLLYGDGWEKEFGKDLKDRKMSNL